METAKTRHTVDDLYEVTGEGLHELIDGEIVAMPPAGYGHGKVSAKIAGSLFDYVRRHGAGDVVVNGGFVLELPYDPDRTRGPDVAFVSTRRSAGVVPNKFFHGAPDLAVEVISEWERSEETQQRVRDYLEAGAQAVWIIAPEARTATVYHADGSARLVREGEALQCEELLPGLSIPLRDALG
jgi:Uma2 family endonuclease